MYICSQWPETSDSDSESIETNTHAKYSPLSDKQHYTAVSNSPIVNTCFFPLRNIQIYWKPCRYVRLQTRVSQMSTSRLQMCKNLGCSNTILLFGNVVKHVVKTITCHLTIIVWSFGECCVYAIYNLQTI